MNLKEKYHPRTFTSDKNILKMWKLSQEGCLFHYDKQVCRVEQHTFPPALETLNLVSLKTCGERITCGYEEPIIDIPVTKIDFDKLKVWRSEKFNK